MADETDKIKFKTQSTYSKSIATKANRKIKSKSNGYNTLWLGLGTMGLIGWSIVLPTLLGVVIGRWIDRNYHGNYSWTLMMLILGLLAGCLNAWYWVVKEDKKNLNI